MMPVVDLLAKVTLLIGSGLLLTLMLRSHSAALRHFVLATSLAAAALVPVLQIVSPPWLPRYGASIPPTRPAQTAAPAGGEALEFSEVVMPGATRLAVSDAGPSAPPSSPWLRALAGAWLTGALLTLAPFAVGLVRLRRLARAARPCGVPAWAENLERVASAYGLKSRPQLLLVAHPGFLATWGVRTTRVVLPDDATRWPEERIRIVLAHELAHVARRDWLVQGFATFVRALYFFHPLVWIAWQRLRVESERACDDAVLNGGVGPEDYATELVNLARAAGASRPSWLPAPAMARASDLEGRVTAMLNANVSRAPLSARARTLVVVVALATLLPLAGAVLLAQTYSTFRGTTRDEFNTPVPGVTLTLSNAGSGQKYEVKSNAMGVFEFVGLPNGDYELQTKLPGFQTRTNHIAIVGRNLQRDVDLQIGSLEETISVRASVSAPTADPNRRPSVGGRYTPPPPAACAASPISGTIKPPVKIADARPIYPEHVRQSATAGVIRLDALIGTDGLVKEATSSDATANPDLVAAAIDAVKLWEFTPTLLNCTPVEVKMKVTVSFSTEP